MRKHFRFYYAHQNKSECLYDGYFDSDAEMITFAQGLVVGLRKFRSTAKVSVYLIEGEGTIGKPYRVQS